MACATACKLQQKIILHDILGRRETIDSGLVHSFLKKNSTFKAWLIPSVSTEISCIKKVPNGNWTLKPLRLMINTFLCMTKHMMPAFVK